MPTALRCVALLVVLTTAVGADSNLTDLAARHRADPFSEFHFVRLHYEAVPGSRPERWLTDYPDADPHLIDGVKRLSRIDIAPEPKFLRIMDDDFFDYPWLYAVEVGGWYLSEPEAARLRDYLLRGGFLMVDDFHGGYEWDGFMESMRRVFPDRPVVEIPVQDAVFHLVYDLDKSVQIPGIYAAMRGLTYEREDGFPGYWRGIYDDQGRLMVVINFNMDLGDAWEHADVPEYALQYTARAYKFAINYMVYAMTH